MAKNKLIDVSISDVKKWQELSHVDDDLIIFDDFSRLPMPDEPLRNTNIIVALCLEGEFCYTTDTVQHHVHKNDALIIHAGQVMDNYCASSNTRGVAFMMSYNFFYDIVKGAAELSLLFLFSRRHPVFNLTDQEVEAVIGYFRVIKTKVDDTTNHFRQDVVKSLMSAMIYDLSNVIYRIQQLSEKTAKRGDAIFTDFIMLVSQHYQRERRVWWYAEQLCISPKYLSETVRQVSRRTPNEWIDHYVIMEIRVQLRNTKKHIKDIASDMKFPNQSSFGKFFKEHVGMSPAAYRKQ